MPVGALILVRPSLAGNLGAAIRVAANFGVPVVELVNPEVDAGDPEVVAWGCGAHERVAIRQHDSLEGAAAPYRTLVGSASARGRARQPVVSPAQALAEVHARGAGSTALVFGNETTGLARADIDRCDLIVRIPTVPEFPVLNLTQAVAILLFHLSGHLDADADAEAGPRPASQEQVGGLMAHLEASLLAIGFLDPQSPDRILRKLRRLFGRAGITDNEVAILRGICRQVDWAAGRKTEDGKR